ncbi:hypothetical protein [Streptomyces sp. cg36]|uniref:hypothetical protein n=1 Tax=Streptomyces sp. cg36 TaxID=3238798 RepID=UPI0034E1CCD6
MPAQASPSEAASTRAFNREFMTIGHQRWADVIEAAAAYMARTHGWRNLHLYLGDGPSVLIPRFPRAVLTYGIFLRHPHPHHGCGCEWGCAWRMIWAPAAESGAVPVTVMRHPVALATGVVIPDPDGSSAAVWGT